jgi:hypothetical protein
MDQTTQRGMPTSYVKKDGTTFQYCDSGAPVVGLAAATRAGGQLKLTKDNTPEQVTVKIEPLPPPDAHGMMVQYHDLQQAEEEREQNAIEDAWYNQH